MYRNLKQVTTLAVPKSEYNGLGTAYANKLVFNSLGKSHANKSLYLR